VLRRMRVDTLASVWDPARPLEARVAAHPLVRSVEVDRKLPGTLVVRLVEHAPVALVPSPSGFRVYDDRGVALPIDPAVVDVDAPILGRLDTLALRLLGAAG
jgi:cell division protein FtsQ